MDLGGPSSNWQNGPRDWRLDAETMMTLTRIESELHSVRDVTLGEDACRVRSGDAPQVLAAIRNAVIHLLGKVKAKSRL